MERPKTSRGKQRPSPDEFTDYVIPSPMNSRSKKASSEFVPIHANSSITLTSDSSMPLTPVPENEMIYRENSNQYNEDLGRLGCWLFAKAFTSYD